MSYFIVCILSASEWIISRFMALCKCTYYYCCYKVSSISGEEQGLKISGDKTEYFEYNEHQHLEIHLQGETVNRVETFQYPRLIIVGYRIRSNAERVDELDESV